MKTEKCVETRYKDQLIVKKDDMFHFYLFNEDGDVSEYKASGISDAKRRIDARIKEQGGLFNSDGELCKDSSDNKEYIVAEEFLHGETGDVDDSAILDGYSLFSIDESISEALLACEQNGKSKSSHETQEPKPQSQP